MILTDNDILAEIAAKTIVIEPYRRQCLGSNSYDVHLGATLAIYTPAVLDAREVQPAAGTLGLEVVTSRRRRPRGPSPLADGVARYRPGSR